MIPESLPATLLEQWQKAGYENASLIQKQVFEPLKTRQNVVGVAPTGSGKTVAYLLPSLMQVTPGGGNQLLILTASQELAMQVLETARFWTEKTQLKVQPLIGGANTKRQLEKLKEKPEILIGTAGRVLELMKTKKIKSHQLQTVIFDEADQLLAGQALEIAKGILQHLDRSCQLNFFSATALSVLPEIKTITKDDFTLIDVTKEDNSQGEVAHLYLMTSKRKKADTLKKLLHVADFRSLIFFNEVAELGAVAEKLQYHNLPVATLASDQNKMLRKTALQAFKADKIKGLLTTDVAARGLDLADLPMIVNVEVPMDDASYLHRAGRVGRMGKKGTVITLVAENDLSYLKKMTKKMALPLKKVFLYGGQLVDTRPVINENEKKSQKMPIEKEKPKPKLHTKESIVKKKNKKRHKKQKNIGKRRV
ncbi:DEAD/DEAH box helicase [Enterococcus sp. MJM12]|uniref:DEAD/DEAH box helicase n=1 Tax=Candidatus Enterococcus myersii TaxID=2815322 RepID=A0ABS3H7L2_9ENTE|nr:DEAD/DEAH box helicase [Enterococcus sp. MJM12]MBO0448890.1 DEAD/DEAH box helicase [Enterococcus sp. MJM12]